jgi:hypothetical protein
VTLALSGIALAAGSAQAAGAVSEQLPSPPPPTATATPTPPIPATTVTQNVFHILSFPFETMTEAVVQMSSKIMLQSYQEAGQAFSAALETLVSGPYGIAPSGEWGSATPLFADLIYPHWQVVLTLALMLLPATLTLTAVIALRQGAVSVVGLAEVKEMLLGWIISVGAAAASYYLLGLAHRLSVSAAVGILQAEFGERVTGATLAGALFNVAALTVLAGNAFTSPIVLYLAFLALFLASTVMLGLGLALAAYIALAYLLTAVAPLVIVLGVLPPVRWLSALWLKSVTVAFMLPVMDALLLKASVSLFYGLLQSQGSGEIGTFIAGLFVSAGVLSVLITLNFKVAEGLFGALAEVQRQASDTVTGLVKLAAVTTGVVLGGGAGGLGLAGVMVGGPAAPPSNSPSTTARSMTMSASETVPDVRTRLGQPIDPTETPGPAADSASASEPVAPPDSGARGRLQRARLAERFGRALTQATHHPVLQGLGLGLQAGHALSATPSANDLDAFHERRGLGLSEGVAPRHAEVEGALRWSKQNLTYAPNDLFDLGRDNTLLMAGGLHQSFVQSGRAMPMEAMLSITRASYGAWRAQGEPGGPAVQREVFETIMDPENKRSPATFIGAFQWLAEQRAFQLDPSFASAVQTAFERGQDIAPDLSSFRRSTTSPWRES